MTTWPDGMDRNRAYRCYTPDADERRATVEFERRYGRPPEHVAVVQGMLRVGPVPEIDK